MLAFFVWFIHLPLQWTLDFAWVGQDRRFLILGLDRNTMTSLGRRLKWGTPYLSSYRERVTSFRGLQLDYYKFCIKLYSNSILYYA